MTHAQPLRAETRVVASAPLEILRKLKEHFVEHGSVDGTEEAWRVEFPIGSVSARLGDGDIAFNVEANDETSLTFLQWGVTEHVHEFMGATPEIVWNGGVAAGKPLPYFREMRVIAAHDVTPRMRRLTLSGANLERFAQHGMHVRLLLAPEKGVVPVWPHMSPDGRQAWPEGPKPLSRIYTIRHIDVAAGEIDLDFVLHEGDDTPGASFAFDAQPGDVVGMTGPGGAELPQADWYLLAGDETALPAIGRLLEEMPAGKKIVALIEIADDGERQDLSSQADLDLRWISRDGRPAGTTAVLQDAVTALPFPDDEQVFVWAGCEYHAFKALRTHLKQDRGLPRGSHNVSVFWRRGLAGEPTEK